ncbi:MAG: hypothetical protein ABI408_13640 [Gemmatimonadaceae bacterium]
MMVPDYMAMGAQKRLREAFRALGAVSPATARPARDLPLDDPYFATLLRQGAIREGAPGNFYLYEPPSGPSRWPQLILFWLVVIILPVAIIQFCARVTP